MNQIQESTSRVGQLAAFIRRKWFWLPLVISMAVASSYWGWEYARFRLHVANLKSLDADFSWAFDESGPDWARRYLGHPTQRRNSTGPILYGPFDKVVKFTARNRGRSANCTLAQIREIANFKHVRTLDLSYSAATDDWLPEIAKIRSLERLDVSHCRISGRGFGVLAVMPNLKHVLCAYCPLRDERLLKLVPSTSLTDLNVALCTHLTTDGLAAFLDRKEGVHVWTYGLRKIEAELKERGYVTSDTGIQSRK
jgi:hypothetical protein